MSSPQTILVIAAHTDDEALGCGGTLARHAALGDTVAALFMTDGVGARHVDAGAREDAERRAAAAEEAAAKLGIVKRFSEAFPDNAMDSVPLIEVVRPIERVIAELGPDVIYTHHAGDLNIDHAITARAVLTACRPQPDFSVTEIYSFEVPSSTEWAGPRVESAFCPSHFVNIAPYWEAKHAALKAYGEEMRPAPHSRSFEAVSSLSQWRGAQVGMERAEAFESLRTLRR